MTGKHWTKSEINILKEADKKLSIEEIKKSLPNRSKPAIIDKMNNLGYKTSNFQNRWNKQDIDILLNCEDMKIDDVLSLFDGRTIDNIRTKARELKINLKLADSWSDEEIRLLNDCSMNKLGLEKMSELLPDRTISAIKGKASVLNLSYDTQIDRKDVTKQSDYSRKMGRLFRYKRDFGIDLDYDEEFETYDVIQWWKWSYFETPNNKKLRIIPSEITKSETKVFEIVRYVLEHELKIDSREKCFDIGFDDFKKYKINFRVIRGKSLCEIINKAFPNYNVKPFEFKNVPLGYWKVKENCDEYLKYVLDEVFVISEFNNVKTELPPLLTFTQMRAMKLSGVTYSISNYRHYESMFHWIDEIYPELGLVADDFNENLGFDGVKVNSSEEIIVYNLLRRDLELDVDAVGLNKSFKFYDEVNENTYVPDFLVNYNGKKIIIEYFGLYREKYGKSKILKDYYYKTIDKIEYFSNLTEYKFIYILHDEIKDLSKLKNKITIELNNIT